MVRSLGRRGWRVIAAGPHALSAGLWSRHADERLCYPNPRREPEATVDALHRAARQRGADLLVPVTDDVALPVAAARHRFAGVCALALPTDAQLEAVSDKAATIEVASQVGVPVPRTLTVTTVDQAVEAGAALGWPVVVKPGRSRRYLPGRGVEAFTVSYAADADELARKVGALAGRVPVLLQEHCGGPGVGVEVLMVGGRAVAAFQHRRLREVPLSGGASSLRESVAVDPTLLDHAVRLLGAIGWTGLAMVEFKVGDDGPRLMEVNGRIWGSLPLAVRSGMDFPGLLADALVGDRHVAAGRGADGYARGVRSRDLELELRWIGAGLRGPRACPVATVPPRREGLRVAARLLRAGDGYDVACLDDPWPGRGGGGRPRGPGAEGAAPPPLDPDSLPDQEGRASGMMGPS